MKGKKFTDEHKLKISIANKGKKHGPMSEETKRKISLSSKGRKLSENHRKKISEALTGKHFNKNYCRVHSKEWHRKVGLAHRGMKRPPRSIEWRRKISNVNKLRIANGTHNFWKGGLTKKNTLIRCSIEYKLWRQSVFKRDNYTCVWCGKRDKTIQADHIKPFSSYPELRFVVENGRTLCRPCHQITDTWGMNSRYINNNLTK